MGGWALWVAVTERGRLIVNQYLKRPLPKSLCGNHKSERAMLRSSWQHQLAESVGLVASCQGEQGNERERERERPPVLLPKPRVLLPKQPKKRK